MFERGLLARRGAATVRVARTCKRLGIATVGLRTEDEEPGGLTSAADELRVVAAENGVIAPQVIVAAAQEAGVDAIHPGYAGDPGLLPLARAAEAADVLLVGLDPDMLELAAERRALRAAAERAGVRVVPGAETLLANLSDAYDAAHSLGFPVAVAAAGVSAGAMDEEELGDAWARVRERVPEGGLRLERDLPRARRVRILLAGDASGELHPLVDREASVIADGHVLLEECPSPELFFRADGEALREMLFDASLRLAREVTTAGLLSVDFLIDEEGRGWLDAVQLGLPAHHGAAERVTGHDLVELQLRLAAGEPLPPELAARAPRGHAFAAAINSREGAGEMRFAGGLYVPAAPTRVLAFEATVVEGRRTSLDDWPTLARLTSSAPVRHRALLTLDRVVAGLQLPPWQTDAPTLRAVLNDERFKAGEYDRGIVPRLRAST